MNRRPCYRTRRDASSERVVVPNCLAVLLSNDIRDCTCDRGKYRKILEERMERMEAMAKRVEIIEMSLPVTAGDVENLRHVGKFAGVSPQRGGALLDLADRLEKLVQGGGYGEPAA